MYGLPQAGKIANDLFKKLLTKSGYYATQLTPWMCRHVWIPITFTLVMDYFEVKFKGNAHANHLVKTLKKEYDVTVDWKGSLLVGINL